MDSKKVTMWTAQESKVVDVICNDGISYVKKEYIDKKYGETAWIFKSAYSFFVNEAARRVKKPEEAESPVWIYADEAYVYKSEGARLLKLSVPAEEIVFFDLRDWNRILNLRLLGNEEEERIFNDKIRQQGAKDGMDIVRTPFYPLLKKELFESWKKLFDKQNLEKKYTEGAVWYIKKEWIEEIL